MSETIPDTSAAATDGKLLSRFVRTVRRKGVIRTLGVVKRRAIIFASDRFDRCFDFVNDVVNGTETTGIIETANLKVTSVHKDRGVRYQPTRTRPFRKLMRELHIPPGEVFVDIGSGKGRVLMMAAALGFKKVVGVEYAQELCNMARQNLSVVRRRKHLATPVVIHFCDAAEYGFNEGETVIYMCNPFDSVVLGKLLENLVESLRRLPRKAWLIYQFPTFFVGPSSLHSVIESHGMFAPAGDYVYGDCEFAVFTHSPR